MGQVDLLAPSLAEEVPVIKTEGLDANGRRRIQREAEAMGRLSGHPHIVTIYDVGEEDGQPYIVSE